MSDARYTVTQYIANTREMMDAVSSARWSDPFITTVLGIMHQREWSGLLAANPYTSFNQAPVTTDANGQFTFASLSTGAADAIKNAYKILAVTDGASTVYRESAFMQNPLAAVQQSLPYNERLYYMAGDKVQILPVSAALALTVTVNWTPVPIDQLSAPSVAATFPSGHENIVWLTAAAELLNKGGAESDAANDLLALAKMSRQDMYADFTRRAARPQFMQYPDGSAEWAGR